MNMHVNSLYDLHHDIGSILLLFTRFFLAAEQRRTQLLFSVLYHL